MSSCAGTIISDRCVNNNILFVCYVSAVLVDGNFRGHVELKLSCYIVYLQTTGMKCKIIIIRYFIAVVFIVLILYYNYFSVLQQ